MLNVEMRMQIGFGCQRSGIADIGSARTIVVPEGMMTAPDRRIERTCARPHKEVVKRARVSSGTVSAIRAEMRGVTPLYRNSESGVCVPFACREVASSTLKNKQAIEDIGGPGRTRTCDLTVMSGQL